MKNSNTVAMIKAVMGATSATGKSMVQKTALVLKDNAGVAMDPALVGTAGPAILEVWFPGQEDGNIVADRQAFLGMTAIDQRKRIRYPSLASTLVADRLGRRIDKAHRLGACGGAENAEQQQKEHTQW